MPPLARRLARVLAAVLFVPSGTALAQITTVNTRLLRHVPIPSITAALENWGYRTATNRYLLQTLGNSGFAIVDTSNPETASVLRTIPNISVADVKVRGSYAYATWDSSPTYVIDLSVPSNATVVGQIADGGHTLTIEGDRLYLNQHGPGQVRIYDLGVDPLAPPLLGAYPQIAVPWSVHDSAIDGTTAYVFGGPNARIVDVSDPANPVVLGTVPGGSTSGDIYTTPSGGKILLTCDDIYAIPWVRLWNVDVPSRPVLLSSYRSSATMNVHALHVRGAYAYIAALQDGLRVLDISNPSAPVEVGVFDQNPSNLGPAFSNTRACYVDHDCIYLTELSNLLGPNMMGAWLVDFFPGAGAGVAGTSGILPSQWWGNGPPTRGNGEFELRLRDTLPGTAAFLIVGLDDSTWNGLALPLSLAPMGLPTGNIYESVDFVLPAGTTSAGRASIALPIPFGIDATYIWTQWAVIDPGAPNPLGLSLTNFGKLRID